MNEDDRMRAAQEKLEEARVAYEAARDAHREERQRERDRDREARHAERAGERADRHAERSARSARIDVDLGPLGSFGVGGEEFTEDVAGLFTVEGAPRIRSRNVSGETRISVGEDGTVRIKATKRVRGSSPEKAKRLLQNVEVRMERHDGMIDIRPHLYEQDRGWMDLFRGGRVSVDLVITVPRESSIEAYTVSGDLALAGTRGALEIQSVSGDVTISDVQGSLTVRSVSGDVRCSEFCGRAEANTVSGDLRLDRCRVQGADVMSVSGDLELIGSLEPGSQHRFKTISGEVDLSLSGDAYEIGYKTMSGDVTLEAEGRVTRDGRRDRTIVVGEAGGAKVIVKTVSGDLTVRSTDATMPGKPTSAMQQGVEAARAEDTRTAGGPVPSTGARDILERLARGELDVDAAAAELDAARSS